MADPEEQILKTIEQANSLPTVPAIAVAILRMSHDPRTSIEKLAETLEKDPALAAKTLRFANSSYYGASQPIVSMPQALVRIGIRGTRMLALSFSLIGACNKIGATEFDFPAFWRRSLTTSVAARRIALCSVRHLAEPVFVGALLSDIGCPVLAATFPQQYRAIEKMLVSGQRNLADLESRLMGVDHAAVGKMVIEAWHLPGVLAEAVGAHHDPQRLDPESEAFNVAAVIMAASDLADIVIRGTTQSRIKRLATTFNEYFSFGGRHMDVLLKDLWPETRSVAAMLDVPVPSVDQVQEAAKSEMLKLTLEQATQRVAAGAAQGGPCGGESG